MAQTLLFGYFIIYQAKGDKKASPRKVQTNSTQTTLNKASPNQE